MKVLTNASACAQHEFRVSAVKTKESSGKGMTFLTHTDAGL